jgi:hypothetical protein
LPYDLLLIVSKRKIAEPLIDPRRVSNLAGAAAWIRRGSATSNGRNQDRSLYSDSEDVQWDSFTFSGTLRKTRL